MSDLNDLDNLSDLVEDVLRENLRSRNDDKFLIYLVLQRVARAHGKAIFIPFELFNVFPSQESITRCRRKLNEQGKYLPTDPVVVRRRERRETEVRDWVMDRVNEGD